MNCDLGLIYYNLRCNNYQAAAREATHSLRTCVHKSDKHAKLTFWRACANGLGCLNQNAIQDLESMRLSYRHLDYAIISALIWFHQRDDFIDEDELRKLDSSLKMSESCIHVDGALLAAEFYFHALEYEAVSTCLKFPIVKEVENSIEKSEDMIRRDPNTEIYRIRLWLNVIDSKKNHLFRSPDWLAVEGKMCTEKNVDFMMAQVRYHEKCGNITEALNLLARVIAKEEAFYPALIEKSKLHLGMGKYHLASELTQKVLRITQTSTEALQIMILIQYVTSYNRNEFEKYLKELVQLLTLDGVSSRRVCIQSAQLFSRISGNYDKVTLESLLYLISTALKSDPTDGEIRLERAIILRRLERYQEATEEYQSLFAMNENSIDVSLGMVRCQLLNGDYCDAKKQFEFISLTEGNYQESRDLEWYIVNTYLADTNTEIKETMLLLFDDLASKTKPSKAVASDIFNPIFHLDIGEVVDVTKYYLTKWPTGLHNIVGIKRGDEWEVITYKVIAILKNLVERYPSNLHGWIILAKIHSQLNQINEAEIIINQCISIHCNAGLAYLTKAQLQFHNNDMLGSQQSLEHALSEEFGLRNHPLYCFVKGSICLREGVIDEARSFLNEAIQSKAVREGRFVSEYIISLDDRISCYIEYGETLKQRSEFCLLNKVLVYAEQEFAGLSKSFYFMKLKSDTFLYRNEVKHALELLTKVPLDSSFFVAAQLERAKLHLEKEKDVNSFIRCHEAVMNNQENQQCHVYIALGDAYMTANLYKHALKAYTHAFEMNQDDEKIVLCVGKVLVLCHQYEEATSHYEKFLDSVHDNIGITIELVSLQINTRKIMEAKTILNRQINKSSQNKDSARCYDRIKFHIKLAQVLYLQNEYMNSKEVLQETIRLHTNFVKTPSFKSYAHGEMKDMISTQVVSLLNSDSIQRDSSVALELCKVANRHDENNIDVLFAINGVLFQQQKFDDCRIYCEKILSLNASHEGAMVVLGKISIALSDFNEAYTQYNLFLEKNQSCYVVIYNLFLLLSKMDKGQEMKNLFEKISNDSSGRVNSSIANGCDSCKGLYYRLTGNLSLAIKCFNKVRCDKYWRKEACINMIEIYLRLEDFDFWALKERNVECRSSKSSIDSINILLQELSDSGGKCSEIELFRGYSKLSDFTDKSMISDAFDVFNSILAINKDHVPALLGIATSFWLNGNSTKMRNTLKRIAKLSYSFESWKEFERSYLLLATTYIGRKKNDLALDLCKRCLFHNKSCRKAWEFMGYIMEGKNHYSDAIHCYRQSWKLNQYEVSLRIGSRLALLYLKTKQFSNAINISTKVIEHSPEYPHMTDVLEKCVLSLRP